VELTEDEALALELTSAEVELADELADSVLLEDGDTVLEDDDVMALELAEDVADSELLGDGVGGLEEDGTLELALGLSVDEVADSVLLKAELLVVMNAELLSLELADEETEPVLLGEGVMMLEVDDALELADEVADSVLLDEELVVLRDKEVGALADEVSESVLLEDTGVDDGEIDDPDVEDTSDEEEVSEALLAEILGEGVSELDALLLDNDAELLGTTDEELEVGLSETE
jgi:hypothetical protein